jgi:enamine deaminase RidA (YjgF/YER057c/UK114 family)
LARARDIGAVYRELLGQHFPAMTAVQVVALIEDRAKVEIECTAVIPKPDPMLQATGGGN